MRYYQKGCLAVVTAGLMVASTGCDRLGTVDDPEVTEPTVEEVEEVEIAQEVGDIGEVDFETSCNAEAQANFEVGLGLLHHMWYVKSREAFEQVVEADSECAMGHWGLAMTHYTPLWYPPEADAVQAGTEAAERAQQLEADEREQAFIDAIAAFYEDYDRADHLVHAEAFRDGWQQAHERDPDDIEAKSFYALGILATAPAITEEYEEQRQAGAMMEEVLEVEPRHPAGHHYLLHAYDFPPLAEDAEEVARSYADIAPAVPHAQHMPAHIFVRLGEWNDVIEWDTRTAEIAEDLEANGRTSMHFYHSLDYITYAYLQQGLDDRAQDTREWFESEENPQLSLGTAYPAVAIPARIAIEQRDWEAAAQLEPLLADEFPWEQWPVAQLVHHTVRAVGAVYSEEVEQAEEEFERIEELNDAVAEEDDPHWAPHAQAYRDLVDAHLDWARGDTDEAIEKMEEVTEFQDSFDKHPTMPGRIIEAGEFLGMMQYADGQYVAALESFEQALQMTPNRYHLYYGAAISAQEADQPEVAARYYEQLLELADPDEVDRRHVDEAQQFLEALRVEL